MILSYVLDSAKQGKMIEASDSEISSPTSADALADFILSLMESTEYGLFHASCNGVCSRKAYALEILKLTGNDTALVKDVSPSLLRPMYTLLDNMMMRITHTHKMPHWRDALNAFLLAQKREKEHKHERD